MCGARSYVRNSAATLTPSIAESAEIAGVILLEA
jgi:hypothetical protein